MRSDKMRGLARSAGDWTADRVWALGYLIKLTLASRS